MTQTVANTDRKTARALLHNLVRSDAAPEKRAKAEALLGRKELINGFDAPTPLVTFEEAQRLLELLPAKYTEAFRALQRETFQRVQAGDQGLHEEVNHNALSSNPVAQLARAGLGISEAIPVGTVLDMPLKRKRAELEFKQEDVGLEGGLVKVDKQRFDVDKERLELDKARLVELDKARLEHDRAQLQFEKERFAFEQEKAEFEREKAAVA